MKRFQRMNAFILAVALFISMVPAGALPVLALDAENTQMVEGSNYLHASYSEETITVDGTMNLTDEPAYRRTISLSGGKLSVAWDKGNLYVAAEAAITALAINGVEVALTAGAKEVKIPFADVSILDLTKTYAFSVKIGGMETAWNAKLIFDANVYARLGTHNNIAYGATTLESNWKFELDSLRNQGTNETTSGQLKYDMYYPKLLSDRTTPVDFAVSYDAPTVVEMDVDVKYLPNLTDAPRTYANWTSRNIVNALAITIRDNSGTANAGDALVTCIYRIGTDIYLMYPDNANATVHSKKIGTYSEDSAATYHLRMEYSYRLVEEKTVADVVYYVNGAKVAEQADVYKDGSWAATGPIIQMVAYGDESTDETKRVEAVVANLSVTHEDAELATYKANYIQAALAAKAVEELIDNIDEVVTLDSEAAIVNARNEYVSLSDAAKDLVPNLSKLEDAEAQLSKLRSGYLHAMFATTAMTLDGEASEAVYTRALWLSDSLKLALAWNHDSLYLAFADTDTPDVSNLAINNMTVDVSSNCMTTTGICEIRIPLESLKITDISKLYTISFQVGNLTWVGNIVFDITAFETVRLPNKPTYGTVSADEREITFIKANDYADADASTALKRNTTYVSFASAGNLVASLATATVVEFDVQIDNLPDYVAVGYNTQYVGRGLNFWVVDDLGTKVNGDTGNTNQMFKFGFFNQGGVLHFGYADSGEHKFVAVDDDGSGKFHVRAEYTYADNYTESGDPQNYLNHKDKVSAKYYVNDVLVGEGTDVRVTGGSIGTSSNQRIYLKADCIKDSAQKTDGKWSNVSVSQTNPELYEGFADVAHVVSLINAIGTVTMESESLIEAARTAYEALADEQKPHVTNLDVLVAAETEIQSLQNAAQTVIDLIAALPAVGELDLDDQTQVNTARTKYNKLTDKQKTLVTNLDILEAAEAEIARLQAIADANAEDQAAADAVIALIQAIGTVTSESDGAIRTADYAFYSLTSTQQALVTNQDVLIAARAAYFALLAPIEYESPENVDAAFSTSTITIDGVLKEEGWRMSGRILDGNRKLYAEYAFQWNQSYLYVAVDFAQAVNTLTITLGSKTFTVKNGRLSTSSWLDYLYVDFKVKDDIVEMRIPMSRLNMGSKVSAYGKSMSMSVKAGSYTGNGKTLHLSNIDWFATENRNHQAPGCGIVSNDAYHGVQKLENGYRLYDLYGGSNQAKIRTSVSFGGSNKQLINLDDRVYDTRIEFDFQAHAMPVLPTDGSAFHSSGGAYANSGFTCCAGELRGADNYGLSYAYGIINTVDGLVFVLNISGNVSTHKLNKVVGDKFSLAVEWTKENMLNLFVDGVQVNTFHCEGHWSESAGNGSLVINMRPMFAPQSAADNYDVSVTNLAFGNVHKETGILAQLDYDDICGAEQTQDNVTSNLTLPKSITNGQLDKSYAITWTSSKPAVISNSGTVTRPEKGMQAVTLTATLSNGETKYFDLIVLGTSIANDGILHLFNDTDPATGVGIGYSEQGFTFDATNNSIIKVLNSKQTVNFVVLKDANDKADLTPETMTLWISNDNITYTRIKDYKLLQVGEKWYLYDFEAEGMYVKVHYTKPDAGESTFFGAYGEMIDAGYETVFGGNNATFTQSEYTLTNNTGSAKLDYAWSISKNDLGIAGTDASIRIYANGKLLYHYVSGSNVVVRIDDLAAGASVKLTVLSSTSTSVMDISNKEGVHEVIYGVQNTILSTDKWYYLTLPAGTTFPDGSKLDKETIFAMTSGNATNPQNLRISVDGGKTWTAKKVINNAPAGKTSVSSVRHGGWIYDSRSGRLMFETYLNKGGSHIHTLVIASDDGGNTWYLQNTLPCSKCTTGDYPYYALSYSDGIELSTNDGAGPNVDFVFPVGSMIDNIGTFACRVAYSKDGGYTWLYSETPITYPSNYGEEGGCSEGWIVERADGVLVLHVRCQDESTTHFKVSYSYDHGLTWTDDNIFTDYYAVNGQAFIRDMEIAGENTVIAAWGGNTSLGNHTYHRNPFVFASSANQGETFRNIQNILFRTFEERYDRIYTPNTTNVSLVSHSGGDLLFTYQRNRMGDLVITNVEDFDDWFTRTKGAYDSFEKGTLKGEGWNRVLGSVEISSKFARGKYAMKLGGAAMAIRSIPYLQDGTLSLDIYVTSGSSFTVELQSAHTRYYDQISVPIALRVEDGKLYFNNSTTVSGDVGEGWNTLTFDLGLSTDEATLSINGGAAIDVPLKENFDDYICYINIGTTLNSTIYVDELLVIDELEADLAADDADQKAADQVVDMLKAIKNPGDQAAVQAVRNAFNQLTQTQKDLVDMRVLANNGESGLAGMINYYELLCKYEDDVWVVEYLINAIGAVTLESEAAIVAAENAHDRLSDDEKAQITNYATLTAARAKLNQLQKELADKIAADKAAAKAVDDQIAALPEIGKLVLTDRAAVEAARQAYAGLTADEVQHITNLAILEAAEAEIDRLQAIADKIAADKAAAKVVDDQIAALPEIGKLVLTDRAAVEAAREAYAGLTADEVQYITNLAILEAAEAEIDRLQAVADKIAADKAVAKAVDDKIAALPAIGVLTLEHKFDVYVVRQAYTGLTEDEAQYITNLPILEAAEAEIDRLQAIADKIEADKAAAKVVDDQIAALPEIGKLVLTDRAVVEAARQAYAGLTADEVQYITNLPILEAAEAEIARLQAIADKIEADKAAAKVVDDKIAALPAIGVLTLEHKFDVYVVRQAYTGLTEDEAQYITNLPILEAAEAEIDRLQAIADKIEADKAAAKVVDDQIAALPEIGKLVLTDRAAVEAARQAYVGLTADEVQHITNLAILEAAEAEIDRLQAVADKIAADKAVAKAVDDKIAALPAIGVLTLEHKFDVYVVRQAYTGLTEDEAQYITNLPILEAAEAEIDRLQAIADKIAADKAAAKVVDDQIAALPEIGKLVLTDRAAVEAAREAYAGLTADEVQHITNLVILEAAEAEIDRLQAIADKIAADKAAAKVVDDKIAALPAIGVLTLEHKFDVYVVRQAYTGLTEDEAQYIINLPILEAAEAEIARLQAIADKIASDKAAAKVVDDQIAALPEIGKLVLTDRAAVEAARQAYAGLTADEVQHITNLAILEAAEAEIARLQAIADKIEADKAAADAVVNLIDAIGTVTTESRAAIRTAEAAYAELTEDQKMLVDNYATLTAARATYNALMIAQGKHLNQNGVICDGEHNAVVSAPSCVEGGYTTYTCPVCGDNYIDDQTPATDDHNYVDGVCGVCGADDPNYPVINKQPAANEDYALGEKAEFTFDIAGDGITYQWYFRAAGESEWLASYDTGCTTATLSFEVQAYRVGRQYMCVIIDAYGNKIESDAVTVKLQAPSGVITKQPEDVECMVGDEVFFELEADGKNLTYQWFISLDGWKTWRAVEGAKTAKWEFTAEQWAWYKCKVTDGSGSSVWTNAVRLQAKKVELAINSQPVANNSYALNETVEFTVEAVGDGLTYQWYFRENEDGEWLRCYDAGCQTATLSFTMQAYRDGREYMCEVKDAYGDTKKSDAVTVKLQAPSAAFADHPDSVGINRGESATFTVEASGDDLILQWYISTDGWKTWKVVSGATSESLTIENATESAWYKCRIKDGSGKIVWSDAALLWFYAVKA